MSNSMHQNSRSGSGPSESRPAPALKQLVLERINCPLCGCEDADILLHAVDNLCGVTGQLDDGPATLHSALGFQLSKHGLAAWIRPSSQHQASQRHPARSRLVGAKLVEFRQLGDDRPARFGFVLRTNRPIDAGIG